MASAVHKDQRATDLCNQIRLLYAIHPRQTGWIASPHHSRKQIQVGHRKWEGNPALVEEVQVLVAAIRHLGLAEAIGYEVVAIWR